ncbi:MAG: hypothetical protein EHM78_20925 [Myxococcaceae bacterium]|nr:MAG: hypothetical protein EHM78_20925 [Myxococcaceae bacterium]
MFAQLIVDQERYGWLFENLAPVVKSALILDKQVKALMTEWTKRDEKDRGGPPLHCRRWLKSPERDKKGERKPDKVLDAMIHHTDPIESEAMTTDWTKPDCPIDTKGLESKVCPALYKALLAHEMSHHNSCKEAYKDPDVTDKTLTQKNKSLRAADEVRAYKAGIAALEKEMMRLAKQKGCGLETCSRDNLAPPPTKEEIEAAQKDIDEIPSIMRSGK